MALSTRQTNVRDARILAPERPSIRKSRCDPVTLRGQLRKNQDLTPGVPAFVGVCLLLVTALVPGAFLRGEVLTQSTLLYEHQPWAAHAPADGAPANPLLYDAPFLFYPLLTHAVAAVQRGELPVWSPALYAGHPFLASFQIALFSPFTAVAYLIPLPHATVVKALAPLIVGGIGMFLYVRRLGLTAAAAWFAGIAYLLNGFAVAWIEHPLTAVACWLPWILLATDALVRQGRARSVAWLALPVTLTILAGHPETTTKVFLLTGTYAAAALIVHAPRRWWLVTAAYALGILLTSIQLVPFFEYLAQSEALLSRETASRNTYFLPVATMIAGLVPDFFGNPATGAYHVPPNRYGVVANYAEQALYAGIPVVVLAAAGAAARLHEWRVRFFVAWAVVALTLMFGLPGIVHAVSALPFLRVMILTRFGLLVIVSLIVLAAYGVDALTRAAHVDGRRLNRTVLGAAIAAIAAVAMASLGALDFLRTHGLTAAAVTGGALAIALLLASSGLVVLRTRGRLSPVLFAVAICTLLAADLLAAGRGFHPTTPPADVYPVVPEIELIQRDTGLFRVYGWGNALVPNAAMAYGLQDARGWDGMNPHRYVGLLDLGYLRQTSEPERHLRNPVLLDLLNVKYVFVGPDVELPERRYVRAADTRAPLYVNTHAFPRAFLVDAYRVLSDAEMQAALHDGSEDLRRVALLEDELPEAERPGPFNPDVTQTVSIRLYSDTQVEIEVDSSSRALLVMSDAYYPGWVATIDDRPVPIRRANYALRAVTVPPGRHIVHFSYRPASLRIGAILSVAALVCWVVLAVTPRRIGYPFSPPQPGR
jgi:hypothetical protein